MDVHPTKNGINRYWSIPILPSGKLTKNELWKITMFNGKINYFYGHFLCRKLLILPEGKTPGEPMNHRLLPELLLNHRGVSSHAVGAPTWQWKGSGSAGDVFIRDFSRDNGKNPLLVGGWPTHLEKYESQWEGWHPIYYGKKKMFQTTNQKEIEGFLI